MGVTVTGALDTSEMFMRLDTTAKERVVRALIKKAGELRRLAIKMAPVDHGNLEAAIKMSPEEYGGRERDGLGRYTRTEIKVYIDMNMAVPDRAGWGGSKNKKVGDYAYEIHEHLTPNGPDQLGPRSKQKDGTDGVRVGGGFMTRAAEQIESGIDAELTKVLAEIL